MYILIITCNVNTIHVLIFVSIIVGEVLVYDRESKLISVIYYKGVLYTKTLINIGSSPVKILVLQFLYR